MARDPKTSVTKPRKKRKHPQASTTGKADPQVDQTNWRVGLQTSRVKFDDAQKAIYLHDGIILYMSVDGLRRYAGNERSMS